LRCLFLGGFLTKQENRQDSDRLDLAKAHAAAGFYNRRDIVEATASAIIRSQALHIILDRYELEHSMKSGHPAPENPKITEIRRKIDDGFYDDPNNMAELVERLIKKFGLD
jgi:hypothetical protein